MLRTGTYVLGWDLSLQEHLGKVAKAEARDSNQTPLMNSYQAKDGRWFFFTGLEANRHVENVYRALGREDLHDDPRFADAAGLRRHRSEVIAVLDEIVASDTLAEWAERFDREGVLVGAGTGSGRRPGRPPAGGQRRLLGAARRGRRLGAAIGQRPDQLLGRPGAPRSARAAPRRAHREVLAEVARHGD